MSFHSAKNEREKVDAWLGASRGLVDIIIGTRSSVFLPMKNLGIIVVDEEHDLSFKQMDKFRYSVEIWLYMSQVTKNTSGFSFCHSIFGNSKECS